MEEKENGRLKEEAERSSPSHIDKDQDKRPETKTVQEVGEEGQENDPELDKSPGDEAPPEEDPGVQGEDSVLEADESFEENVVPVDDPESLGEVEDPDSFLLFDPAAGYLNPKNLKEPLKGFIDADEQALFPLIDAQSMQLFQIVQTLEKSLWKRSEQALINHKLPVPIPSNKLLVPDGGPQIKLRILDPHNIEEEEEEMIVPTGSKFSATSTPTPHSGQDKVPERLLAAISRDAFSPEKLAMLMTPLDKGWRREIVMRSQCSPGKKLGDVYYFSPEGAKFRSSKQVAIYLSKKPELEMSSDMFSFAKSRVSYDPGQETVRQAYVGKSQGRIVTRPLVKGSSYDHSSSPQPYDGQDLEDEQIKYSGAGRGKVNANAGRRSIQPPKRYATGQSALYPEKKPKLSGKANQEREMDYGGMEMGMLPPKYPRGMEDSNNQSTGFSSFTTAEDQYGDSKRRGRPPKPGGKKDLLAQAQAIKAAKSAAGTLGPEEDEALFGISAFTQSAQYGHFSDGMGGYSQHFGRMEGDNYEDDEEESQKQRVANLDDGLSQDEEELLPCSIRCPGMTGEVPTLQCRRCLCLYHPGCLGLPKNQIYRNFFCSNCDTAPGEEVRPPTTAGTRPPPSQGGRPMGSEMKKPPGEGKKPPPPLLRANFPKGVDPNSSMLYGGRKVLPKMPNLQPPSNANSFGGAMRGRMGGPSGAMAMKSRMLNPPPLKMLKKPEQGGAPSVSVSSIDMRNAHQGQGQGREGFSNTGAGRGRLQKPNTNNVQMPHLNNRSLTITPISIPRKGGIQPPPVPKLQPMMMPGAARRYAYPRRPVQQPQAEQWGRRPPMAVPVKMQPPRDYRGQMNHILKMQREDRERSEALARQGMQQQRAAAMRPPTENQQFRRYPQSIISMEQRKYIAMPRALRLENNSNVSNDTVVPSATVTSSSNEGAEGNEQHEETQQEELQEANGF